MSYQIDQLPHSCGTSKGLKVFAQEDGAVTGYCFSCSTFVKNPYGDERTTENLPPRKEKTPEEIQAEIAEVEGYQFLDVRERRLRKETLEKFGARVSVSEKDGKTPTAIYWPVTKDGKLTGYHIKSIDKKFKAYNIGETKGADPLNWESAKKSGARKIIITEGPEDMASVDRIFEMCTKESDKQYHPAVISLPHGSASAKKVLSRLSHEITSRFKEIILCYDDDTAGQLAVKQSMQYLPDARSVKLPYKDANECLQQGAAKAAYNAICFQAAKPKNSSLVFGADLHDKAREPARHGLYTWPWPKMNKALRGIRTGETIYLGAGVKMGKGEVRNAIAAHLMKEHDAKIFMASPEEANAKTYKMLAGKLVGEKFHDPDVPFNFDKYDEAGEILKERLAVVDLYQHIGWESLRKDMLAAAEWGAKAHFVDPITNLTNGVNAADANTILQGIAQDMSALALDLDITIFIYCHLKAPEGNISADQRKAKYSQGKYTGLGNCPHELGGDVLSAQFAGSRAMMR